MNLEHKTESMLKEIKELKYHVLALEEKNRELAKRVLELEAGEEKEGLKQLYAQGFHICPARFGNSKNSEEDCLLCLALIERSLRGGQKKVVSEDEI